MPPCLSSRRSRWGWSSSDGVLTGVNGVRGALRSCPTSEWTLLLFLSPPTSKGSVRHFRSTSQGIILREPPRRMSCRHAQAVPLASTRMWWQNEAVQRHIVSPRSLSAATTFQVSTLRKAHEPAQAQARPSPGARPCPEATFHQPYQARSSMSSVSHHIAGGETCLRRHSDESYEYIHLAALLQRFHTHCLAFHRHSRECPSSPLTQDRMVGLTLVYPLQGCG